MKCKGCEIDVPRSEFRGDNGTGRCRRCRATVPAAPKRTRKVKEKK